LGCGYRLRFADNFFYLELKPNPNDQPLDRRSMKRLIPIIIATLALNACGGNTTVATTTTTIKPKPTTVAPIDYGSDCNTDTLVEIERLAEELGIARDKWEEDNDKSRDKAWEALSAYSDAYKNLRSYIRTLDIPLISAEQKNFVDAIQDYVDGKNRYWESGRQDLSVNDYLIPLSDAGTDFYNAMWDICSRTNYNT
jgi:hypothetical protein